MRIRRLTSGVSSSVKSLSDSGGAPWPLALCTTAEECGRDSLSEPEIAMVDATEAQRHSETREMMVVGTKEWEWDQAVVVSCQQTSSERPPLNNLALSASPFHQALVVLPLLCPLASIVRRVALSFSPVILQYPRPDVPSI